MLNVWETLLDVRIELQGPCDPMILMLATGVDHAASRLIVVMQEGGHLHQQDTSGLGGMMSMEGDSECLFNSALFWRMVTRRTNQADEHRLTLLC
jgi:hypothetical protein